MTKKRRRPIHLHVMVSEEEQALIQERMDEAGIRNMGAYMRKMALNGYVLHVDLSPVRELVSLQRRCSNNLNQVAIQANTYGGIYPQEIASLQRDYAALWEPLADLLKKLAAVVEVSPMSTPNLYWPVYKNLEKEFLKLADYIHFSDDQLGTYSMFIADLIVRCSVEIEALSKELYCMLGGNMSPTDPQGNNRDLYFDTDCLNLLDQKWTLSKKQIAVSAISFYFVDDKNKILTPLHKAHKRGTSGSKWKQAYQAVKHDRRNSLKKASIENLLSALGALYIPESVKLVVL